MKLAIIGLDIALEGCPDVAAFERAIYAGLSLTSGDGASAVGTERVVYVAENALRDAGIRDGETAVVIATDKVAQQLGKMRTGRRRMFRLRSIAVVPDGDNAVFVALSEARRLLDAGEVDVALVALSDQTGTGAIVVVREDAAQLQRVYATVDTLGWGDVNGVRATCQRALDDAGLTPVQVGYLESTGPAPESAAEIAGLLDAYRTPSDDLTCALGSSGAVSGIIRFIKTVLCLHRRFLPGISDRSDVALPERWRGSPFYVLETSQTWFLEPDVSKRTAALSSLGRDGKYAHAVLSEPAQRTPGAGVVTHLAEKVSRLFPLAGDSRDALLAQLEALRRGVEGGTSLRVLAQRAFAASQHAADARYLLAIVGHNRDGVLREIDFAVKGLDKAFESGTPWSSPQGSYFTPEPLGREGGVAFVYPGAFNSYPGMGRDLFQLFPFLHERFAEVTANASRTLATRLLYPRSVQPPTDDERAAQQARLLNDPIAMIESGASFAILYTMMMRDVFGVQPQSALGYSLGEISMLWAMGVWRNGDEGSDAWHESPLFKTRLFGPMDAVRESWGLRRVDEDDLWQVHILKADAKRVRAALANEPRVYLTIVNAPREVVIAGDPAGCARVIAALDCHALRVPFNAVIHNDAMRSEYAAFVDLYTLPVHPSPGIDFYSAAGYAPLTLTSSALAHAIADVSCKPIDFERLVTTVYDNGARVFVELGPLGTCSRWIRRILGRRPHAVMPINRSGAGDLETILAVLAQLLSHRVPVDVSALYAEAEHGLDYTRKRKSCQQMATPERRGRIAQIFDRDLRGLFSQAYYDNLRQHVERVAEGHSAFLAARQTALRQTAELIELQMDVARQILSTDGTDVSGLGQAQAHPAAIFDEEQIAAFAAGDVADCFGSMYDAYKGRRFPRIPNGDLMLMSRILEIDGTQGEVRAGSSLVSEYDVPAYPPLAPPTTWEGAEGGVPYAVLMEIALQPCGFLSAYSGSMFPYPETDFYFRNLDGEGTLLRDIDLRGKTITNRVELLSSTAVRGIIIQKYAFAMACEGEDFYRGTSSFGYFTLDALVNQVGLDGAQVQRPWIEQAGERDVVSVNVGRLLPGLGRQDADGPLLAESGRLRFLDKVRVVVDGGQHGRGYVFASVKVDPVDWFFANHFLDDPVMPGSLGVEAMRQAMLAYVVYREPGRRTSQVAHVPHQTQWKYRGQIPPERDTVHLEVNIAEIAADGDCVTVIGDGNLWRQGLRIYEVKGLALRLA